MYGNLFTNKTNTLADTTTVFGDVIRQVAEQFMLGEYNGKPLVEYTKDNTDDYIKKLWMCYQGSVPTGNEFARSYCAVGAWLTIQTAANIVSCANMFPKGLGGNVQNTFFKIQNQTNITIDTTPAVGSVFVRESTHNGNNHMGIVTSVNEAGTVIQAIEWNAGLDQVGANTNKVQGKIYGGVSNVAYYPEKYNQFKYWKFIHFENMCNVATLPCGTYKDSCFGIDIEITGCEIVKTDTPDIVKKTDTSICENYTCPPGYRKLTTQEFITRGNPNVGSKQNSTEYYKEYCCVPDKQTTTTSVGTKNPKPCPTIIKTGCDTGSIKVNYPDKIPHYSEAPNIYERILKWCAPDIKGGKAFKPNPIYESWLQQPPQYRAYPAPPTHIISEYQFEPDGNFPILTDNNGNTFICIAYGSVMHELVRKYKLDGGDKAVNIVINVQSLLDNGYDTVQFRNKLASMYLPPNAGNWANKDSYDDEFIRYNNNKTPKDLGLPDIFSATRNFYSAMEMIERTNKKYDKTFILVGIGESEEKNAIDAAIESSFITIVNIGLKAVGVPAELVTDINTVYSLLQNFSSNPSNLGNIFQLAGFALPKEYKPYLAKAQTIASALQNPSMGNVTAALQAAQVITKELNGGDMPEWIQWGDKQVNSVYPFVQNQWRSVFDFVNATEADVAKTVQSYSNYTTALYTGAQSSLDGWTTKLGILIDDNKDIFSDSGKNGGAGLQNIFTTSTKGAALALLPNAQKLIGGILSNPLLSAKTVTDVAEHAALLAIATGKNYADEQVRGFQLKSLLNKAEDAVRANVPFALPAIWSFAEDKDTKEIGECFAREIEVCLNINVCRSPKTMVNGFCTTPKNSNTTTTTTNNVNVRKNPNIDITQAELPPDTLKLPDCIVRLSTGDYYYCPDTDCDSMIWKNLNVISPYENRDTFVNPNRPINPVNPTNPNIGVNPTSPGKPIAPFNGNANGGSGYYGNMDYSTPIQTDGNPDQAEFYRMQANGEIGAPQLSEPNCNILYPALYIKNVWYAQIGGRYITIQSCCPTELPETQNDCCDATQKNIQALAGQIVKLQELLLRNSAGEKTPAVDLTNITKELTAIHTLIDGLRTQKPLEIKQIDITPLQKQINDLQTAVKNINVTIPQGNGTVVKQYDDSGLRQQITDLRSLITQTKNDSERPYNDELQIIMQNFNTMKTAYDRNLQILLQEIRTQGNTPILQTDYNRLISEKNIQIAEYQKRIDILQQQQQQQDRKVNTQSSTTQTRTPATLPTTTTQPQQPGKVPTRTYDELGRCTNCPVLEETHTRRIYEYPQQQAHVHNDCESDNC